MEVMRIKNLCLKFLVVLVVSNSASVCGQSLEDAIRITLKTNPDIQAGFYGVAAAEELKNQVRGGFFPSVDLVFSGGHEESNNTTTRALGEDGLDMTRVERSIKVTQLLFDGNATRNLVRQQGAMVNAALARLLNAQESTSLRVIQVYMEVLRRGEIVRLSEQNLGYHDETLKKINERYQSGVGTKVDVIQTRGRQAQSKSNVLLARRDSKNGDAEYYRVVGEYPSDLIVPENLPSIPSTLEAAIQIALSNNPNIKAIESELEAAVAARKQARASFYPRFDLEVGATRNDDTDGSVGPNDDETAVVRMTYNIYRGGADRARLNEAEAQEFAVRESLRSARRAVQEDTTLVWNELQDILLRIEYLEAHVKSTTEVLAVYREQLSLGKRTLLDLLDVQNELLRAQIVRVSGDYAALFARYRVLASIGNLLGGMSIEVEQSLD